MRHFLDFERPIAELEGKIEELRHLSTDSGLNIAEEVGRLEAQANRLLRQSYARQHPVSYWLHVPGSNLFKTFFKSSTAASMGGAKDLAIRGLFGYRSLLMLVGLLALWVHRREPAMWAVGLFVGGMIFFICLIMRNLEMRYLLQADVLLLLPAAVLLGELADRLLARRPAPAQPLPAEAA